MKKMSHTEHMSILFMKGEIRNSMSFELIARIMTVTGLDTTESQAMNAYDTCMMLGYPRGGNPKAFPRVDDDGNLTDMLSQIPDYCYNDPYLLGEWMKMVGIIVREKEDDDDDDDDLIGDHSPPPPPSPPSPPRFMHNTWGLIRMKTKEAI